MAHRQLILGPECRCINRVRGWSNGVRDRSATAPATPDILNVCAIALRRSCGNRVARAGLPRKGLGRTIASAINSERDTGQARLHGHLNRILSEGSVLGNWPIHRD